MSINLIDIYPQAVEINNEINLIRIVDKKIKESLVFYCLKNDNLHKVYMMNTMTGEEVNIKNYSEKLHIDNLIGNIKSMEFEINKLESLEKVEKYILKRI